MKQRTPRVDLRRVAQQDVRRRRVRLHEGWRQAASAGVREGGGRGASDSGAPGPAHCRCETGPGARASPGRGVLKLKPPQPAKTARPLPLPSWEGGLGWAGVCLLEMKGFCAGSACGSWAPRQRPSPPALLPPATPKRAPVLPMLTKRPGLRLLTVGTDCSVGKKYTVLALEKEMRARGLKADFRATGQTGIFISG
ncbi:DUF1611 domain-containing protein, partial [Pyxidicoccus caerfyrddinensis]|uniref:DUF1611 domain-containing protein n=1 Tax=Pyxidicoccus caerfyrddinensis TaxID=2709663 RepID=UPI003083F6BE